MYENRESARLNAIGTFIEGMRKRGAAFAKSLIGEFEEQEGIKENALKLLFQTYNSNVDIHAVLVKVTCLNDYYGTRLRQVRTVFAEGDGKRRSRRRADILSMANHIVEIEGLDDYLEAGSFQAVNQIKEVYGDDGEHFSRAYSFATKYCSWHQPDKYPILDGYVKAMVYYLGKYLPLECMSDQTKSGFASSYENYVTCYSSICNWICDCCGGLGQYSYKKIDELLWWYAARKHGEAGLYIS